MQAGDDAIVIEMAGAPAGKGRPRFRVVSAGARSFGQAYTDSKTRRYESDLRYAAQRVMQNRLPLDGALDVVVFAAMPVPASWSRKKREQAFNGVLRPTGRPDADNVLKSLDALNQIVFVDDKQIVDARIVKFYSERPSLRIEVRLAAPLITSCLLDERERVAL